MDVTFEELMFWGVLPTLFVVGYPVLIVLIIEEILTRRDRQ